MSTASTSARSSSEPILVVSRTNLFYWWPVWFVGLLLAAITYFDDTRLAVLPGGTKVKEAEAGKGFEVQADAAPGLVKAAERTARNESAFPVRISQHRGLGIVWFSVILLVIFSTNIPLRGVATVMALVLLVLMVVLFSLLEWWSPILEFLGGLHIQITLAGYLLPSTALLVMWLTSVFLYDPLRYAKFSQGQLAIRQAVGAQAEIYPTMRIHVEKKPSDLLRHYILGLGAGDLIIQIPGQPIPIELPNVLFIDWYLRRITQIVKTQTVEAG